jgi:hypothetical protein
MNVSKENPNATAIDTDAEPVCGSDAAFKVGE